MNFNSKIVYCVILLALWALVITLVRHFLSLLFGVLRVKRRGTIILAQVLKFLLGDFELTFHYKNTVNKCNYLKIDLFDIITFDP